MREYAKLSPRLWLDSKFRALPDDARLAFIWTLTCPAQTGHGAFTGNPARLASELGWTTERAGMALQALVSCGMIEMDTEHCVISVPRFLTYNPPPNSNAAIFVARCFEGLPECQIVRRHIQRTASALRELSPDRFAAFAKGLAESVPETVLETIGETLRETLRETVADTYSIKHIAEKKDPGASAPPPADAGRTPSSRISGKEEPDPLEERPELHAIHVRLRERIAEAHPKARLPREGSAGWSEERRTVARLVDLDGYTPEDLRGCFGWLFMSQDKDATFWRGQVCAIAPLRQTKNGMAKIARIFEAWERAKASGIGGDAPSFKIPANLKALRAREVAQ